jgi:hypothetical protein
MREFISSLITAVIDLLGLGEQSLAPVPVKVDKPRR